MGTKTILRSHDDPGTGFGFHLYSDWIDECSGLDVLHLAFDGCDFEASCFSTGPTRVTVTMPRSLAVLLGVAGEAAPGAEASEADVVPGLARTRDAVVPSPPTGDLPPGDAARTLASLLAKVLRLSDEARDAATPTEATAKLLWMQRSIQEGRGEASRLVATLLAPAAS